MANELKTVQEETTQRVLNRINAFKETGELKIPPNYSPENALKSAWLILLETKNRNKQPVLETCSKESIANCLLDMVIQGLSPAKKQCYFVAYGDKLTLMRSYMGTIAVAKRVSNAREVHGACVYEGDKFEFKIDTFGQKIITCHEQSLESLEGGKIRAAYAVVTTDEDDPFVEIMTMAQIKNAWGQGELKGGGPAHIKFPDQMAIKTVCNRACKLFINTSDDSDVLIEAFNRSNAPVIEGSAAEIKPELEQKANKEVLDFKGTAREVKAPVSVSDTSPIPGEIAQEPDFAL